MQQRYEELRLTSALSRPCDYAQACHELAAILKGGYRVAPRRLQNAIFEDVQTAVLFIPNLELTRELSAVNMLVQAAEIVFPRQKKSLLVSEFKHRAVMQQRRLSRNRETESACLDVSRDVLIKILGFVDVQSLAAAALVCRSWRVAANEESLWKAHFLFHFGEPNTGFVKVKKSIDEDKKITCMLPKKSVTDNSISWKRLFKDNAQRHPLRWFKSSRVLCKTCDSFIWIEAANVHMRGPICSLSKSLHHKLKPLVPVQVVQLLIKDSLTSSSSSSSGDDSDDNLSDLKKKQALKLWAFPKCYPDADSETFGMDLTTALEKVGRLQLG